MQRPALYAALGAIALWASVATLGVHLAHVPPFLLTGVALLVGSLLSLPLCRFRLSTWVVPAPTLAVGVYGLFGFHFLLFMALRLAPPVEANLVNYLWPLLIVVLAPVLLPDVVGSRRHVFAALLGLAGAALAITSGTAPAASTDTPGALQRALGYGFALGSAIIWSTYSLLCRRVRPFPTAAIGGFGAVSGALALLCHALLEPRYALTTGDALALLGLGAGPLGAAFFLWDVAVKGLDPRALGVLSYLTPLGSTVLLMGATGRAPDAGIAVAAALILGGAWLGRIR